MQVSDTLVDQTYSLALEFLPEKAPRPYASKALLFQAISKLDKLGASNEQKVSICLAAIETALKQG